MRHCLRTKRRNESWSVGQVIAAIHDIEDALASGATESYVEWLEEEIEEYDGQDHADAAKELLTALKEGDIYD